MRQGFSRADTMRLVLIGLVLTLGFRALAQRAPVGRETAAPVRAAWRRRAQVMYDILAYSLPRWQQLLEAWQAGQAQGARRGAGPARLHEAREILGVGPGAGREEINAAYRERMRKFHPDQGGSAEMASRINAARDVLLKDAG